MLTRYEQAIRIAKAYGYTDHEAHIAAKHIFAKMITGGATIARINGRMVVLRERSKHKWPG